jgi:hypothetical protein
MLGRAEEIEGEADIPKLCVSKAHQRRTNGARTAQVLVWQRLRPGVWGYGVARRYYCSRYCHDHRRAGRKCQWFRSFDGIASKTGAMEVEFKMWLGKLGYATCPGRWPIPRFRHLSQHQPSRLVPLSTRPYLSTRHPWPLALWQTPAAVSSSLLRIFRTPFYREPYALIFRQQSPLPLLGRCLRRYPP